MPMIKTGTANKEGIKKIAQDQTTEELTKFASQSHAAEEDLQERGKQKQRPKADFSENHMLGND